MKRITLAALALIAFLPAEASALTVRVGSLTVERPCLIAENRIVLAPRDPNLPPTALATPYPPPQPPTGSCKGHPALRLNRARRVTITAQNTERITATWFEGSGAPPSSIPVRSTAAWDTWLLTLPLTSGRLVLSQWYWPTYLYGPLTQRRGDYKLSIRRTVRQPPQEAGPPATEEAEPNAVTMDDSG
jgi:hypothetical protein